MPLSVGSTRRAERLQIYAFHSTPSQNIPCTTIWRGSASKHPSSDPKPYSYQVYVTDPSITPPEAPSSSTSPDQINQPAQPTEATLAPEGFAKDLLEELVDKTPDPETWRLDIWYPPSTLAPWGAQECIGHYRSTAASRREQGTPLQTVSSYFSSEAVIGTHAKGLLLMVDGGGEGGQEVNKIDWREEGRIQVVEFERGVGEKVAREDGEGLETRVTYTEEEGGRFEKKYGTTVGEWRGSVRGKRPLGRWLGNVWRVAKVRLDY